MEKDFFNFRTKTGIKTILISIELLILSDLQMSDKTNESFKKVANLMTINRNYDQCFYPSFLLQKCLFNEPSRIF